MTDKTDRQKRSGCWSITSFDEEEWGKLTSGNFPEFVKEVYGGLEECPETKRKHFQGAIKTAYCRFSQVKGWLGKAHIESALHKDALIKYAMKQETSIEEKKMVKNEKFFQLEDVMKLLGKTYVTLEEENVKFYKYSFVGGKDIYSFDGEIDVPGHERNYWIIVRTILRNRAYLCGILSNPQTYRLWKNTAQVWIDFCDEASPISITGRSDE